MNERMKKIGIITHYYNSENYGGNLQAYALCAYLRGIGYGAEQISFRFRPEDEPVAVADGKRDSNAKKLTDQLRRIPKLPVGLLKKWEEKRYRVNERRTEAFRHFNKQVIPHSQEVYDKNTVADCVKNYDAFITGSDQVWNFKWYHPAFFLDFVPSEKTKLSYAASLAVSALSEEQKAVFEKSLRDFVAVSVREKQAAEILSPLSPVSVEHSIDPTLLLSREQWDEVASPRLVAEDYAFCYFLGDNRKSRRIAKAFAKKKGLKLVTLPHAGGWIKAADLGFGEIRLFDASPSDFLSLIKHATYVFTDSFHATVFSHLYRKTYFVFHRSRDGEMSTRITDLLSLFETRERFCGGEKENLAYVDSLVAPDYRDESASLKEFRQASEEFLKNHLGEHLK